MSYYSKYPDKIEDLLKENKNFDKDAKIKVNAHLHTPYSFSAFDSISQALDMAVEENVKVLGINDFYTADGYEEWAKECELRGLFPLFNIEFISLNKEDQKQGIRVNDPNNPGRTYLSGKGLAYPFQLKSPWLEKLNNVKAESNRHVEAMCHKLNDILKKIEAPFSLSFNVIEKEMTHGSVRERHLAKALRLKAAEYFNKEEEQSSFYKKLFGGNPPKADADNWAALENEIRGNLLKAGGNAFIAEDPKAFLEMETVRQIIINAGGIPTYPFLADDANGNFTDFENDKALVAAKLKERGIFSVEFITTRNSLSVLEEYVEFFYDEGFIISMGSEHNSPVMEPISLLARNNTPLSDKINEINLKGAAVIAAHQYLIAKGMPGYLDEQGNAKIEQRKEMEKLGRILIEISQI